MPGSVKRRYDASSRRLQAGATRERILTSARTRFFRDGYAATTIADIAHDAGVCGQTVYKAFQNKAGLLLPPPPPGAGGPFALSQPGALEQLVRSAELTPGHAGEVPTPYTYPDVETAVRAKMSSGPAVRAAQHARSDTVRAALTDVVAGYRQTDGAVRLDNVFRYLVATTTP